MDQCEKLIEEEQQLYSQLTEEERCEFSQNSVNIKHYILLKQLPEYDLLKKFVREPWTQLDVAIEFLKMPDEWKKECYIQLHSDNIKEYKTLKSLTKEQQELFKNMYGELYHMNDFMFFLNLSDNDKQQWNESKCTDKEDFLQYQQLSQTQKQIFMKKKILFEEQYKLNGPLQMIDDNDKMTNNQELLPNERKHLLDECKQLLQRQGDIFAGLSDENKKEYDNHGNIEYYVLLKQFPEYNTLRKIFGVARPWDIFPRVIEFLDMSEELRQEYVSMIKKSHGFYTDSIQNFKLFKELSDQDQQIYKRVYGSYLKTVPTFIYFKALSVEDKQLWTDILCQNENDFIRFKQQSKDEQQYDLERREQFLQQIRHNKSDLGLLYKGNDIRNRMMIKLLNNRGENNDDEQKPLSDDIDSDYEEYECRLQLSEQRAEQDYKNKYI